jgi:DNA repair protein RecO (recombination protein O)
MPARESEAIILRSFPLGEGDRLISFFSRAEGRLRGVASGARKPKSRFGSTLELFSYVRIWYYERETRDLVRISQCDLIESFMETQSDYASALAFALLSEATEAVLGEREPAEANFRLLLVAARALKAGAAAALALAYFSFWSVRLGGWMPRLDRCSVCGTAVKEVAYISGDRGVICGNCRLPGQRAISQQALLIMKRISTEKLEQLMRASIVNKNASEVMDFMLDVIEYHIEKRLQSRRLLEEYLEHGSTPNV